MDKKTILLVVVFFVLIVAGMFVFAHLKRTEMAQLPSEPEVIVETEVAYPDITRIEAKHFFIDGTHTYVGQIDLPTPCDLIEVGSTVQESYPEQINLAFNVINNSEMCAQVVTTQRFMVTAAASAEATTKATFMGRAVELNLIPAAAGETPDEFELFIKG